MAIPVPGPLLELQDLKVVLPTAGGPAPILAGISFSLRRGETLGLVGESGCGKSVTALAIMGLLPPRAATSGAVLFDGRNLLTTDEPTLCGLRGRRIGMIFQEPMTALNPVRSIGAQVAEGLLLHLRLGRAEAEARTRRVLDRVGLPAPRFSPDLYPHQLSGGQRQRVMIAMALALEPDLLIADEPTTALDVTIQAQILDLLGSVVDETGMALMLITHDLGVVAEMTERVMVMYSGGVVEAGATPDVFGRVTHPYTQGLFAASPHAMTGPTRTPDGRRRRLNAIGGQVPDPRHRPPGCAFAERCPRVAEDCRRVPPTLAAGAGPGGHAAACFHPIVAP
ncbi:MAG TPA: ABC transporter ATP-binding protein [Stellaceae bacterium]|nr:ABC transporter ATP-binding protein [Stellaceae bacterium]